MMKHTPTFADLDDKVARYIEGSLSLMPIAELIQWIDRSRYSGTLVASNEELTRRFFFQEGSLIFLWAEQEAEELCLELSKGTGLDIDRIIEYIRRAEQLGISFLGFLSSEEGIRIERLTSLMATIAEKYLTASFSWKTGHFRFVEQLPPAVLCSPIILNPSQLLMESAVQYDEADFCKDTGVDPVLDEVFEMIRKGAVDIPPIPTEMQVLMNRISDPDLSVDEIIECIHDPLLVSKVLRICNSSYYGHRNKVGTLREAVVYMGLKSLISIVTVHAMSGFSPRNTEQVKGILHHSMMVGMIARELARNAGANHEQAFICGLLHDIGWVVMLEMLGGYDIKKEKRDEMIRAHHCDLGYLVARQWNFSEDIQEVARYHHDPESAQHYRELVEIVHSADLLAKNEANPEELGVALFMQPMGENPEPFSDHLEQLDREIEAILAPAR